MARKHNVYEKIVGRKPQDGSDVILSGGKEVQPQSGVNVVQQEGITVQPPIEQKEGYMSDSMTVKTQDRNAVLPLGGTTGTQQKGSTAKRSKITLYPSPGQEQKLERLIIQYYERHQRLVNQNDLLRHLIDQCTIDDFEGME